MSRKHRQELADQVTGKEPIVKHFEIEESEGEEIREAITYGHNSEAVDKARKMFLATPDAEKDGFIKKLTDWVNEIE